MTCDDGWSIECSVYEVAAVKKIGVVKYRDGIINRGEVFENVLSDLDSSKV